MSSFPQSVTNPSAFPTAFLGLSPRVVIQVAIVHLHVPKNLEWPRWVGGRGALMHGLQGAEAQGPTLERGPTGCREIIFFE